ncbi:hypothetical protein M0804_012180 [Polistes exclamans]|nr:hypothetical protein M0804_012180 [Polistes exclamans]
MVMVVMVVEMVWGTSFARKLVYPYRRPPNLYYISMMPSKETTTESTPVQHFPQLSVLLSSHSPYTLYFFPSRFTHASSNPLTPFVRTSDLLCYSW